MFWVCFGYVLGMFSVQLGSVCGTVGYNLDTFWARFGHASGTFLLLLDDGIGGNGGNRGSWGKTEIGVTEKTREMGVLGETIVREEVAGK